MYMNCKIYQTGLVGDYWPRKLNRSASVMEWVEVARWKLAGLWPQNSPGWLKHCAPNTNVHSRLCWQRILALYCFLPTKMYRADNSVLSARTTKYQPQTSWSSSKNPQIFAVFVNLMGLLLALVENVLTRKNAESYVVIEVSFLFARHILSDVIVK